MTGKKPKKQLQFLSSKRIKPCLAVWSFIDFFYASSLAADRMLLTDGLKEELQ